MMPPNATLLVIDDASDTLSFIHDALTPEGFNCLLALDAEQGFHIAQKMLPDLILLDGILPTTSGFELCERCHNDKELARTPIIFMTGLQDNESLAKAFAAGCVDYVTKPINTTNLIARIRVHLASSRLIQRTQLALDQAGQHLFAVSPTGEVLWQTPEVQNLLSAHSAAWLNAVFYPSLTHWVTHPDAPRLLRLQTEKSAFLQLEWLAGSYLNPYTEILVRLHNDDNKKHEQQLVTAFALSAREAEVLLWLSRGKTNKEIAHILAISARTINKHLEQVFKKVGVDNRTQAAAQALAQLRQ